MCARARARSRYLLYVPYPTCPTPPPTSGYRNMSRRKVMCGGLICALQPSGDLLLQEVHIGYAPFAMHLQMRYTTGPCQPKYSTTLAMPLYPPEASPVDVCQPEGLFLSFLADNLPIPINK